MSLEPKTPLYPVLSAEDLLAHPKRYLLLEKYKKYSGLEEHFFQALYQPLIYRFIEWVQALPFQPGGRAGGLMDYGLERADFALQSYREGAGNQFTAIYAYAVFSAALMQDVGKVVSQQRVFISDAQGGFVQTWSPFEGSIVGQGEYYKLRFLYDRWKSLETLTPLLFARQLMPPSGFNWLMEDSRIAQLWLGAFCEDSASGGALLDLLRLVHKRVLDLPEQQQLPPLHLQVLYPEETRLGEAFLSWLQQGLQAGSILINHPKAALYTLAGGGLFLECPRLFQFYRDASGCTQVWLEICRQFVALGLVKQTATLRLSRFYFRHPEQMGESSVKTTSSYFSSQTKQQKLAGAAPSAGRMIREGLVVRPEDTALILAHAQRLEASAFDLQPVDSDLPAKEVSEQTLSRLMEREAVKQLAQRHGSW